MKPFRVLPFRSLAALTAFVAFLMPIALIGSPGPARAASLRFEPSAQSVAVGGFASVDLLISGLGGSGAPSLGGFDLDVRFSSSVIAYSATTFGSLLGDPGLNEVQNAIVLTFERTNLLALSFLDEPALDSLQASDAFVLATLTFRGVTPGTSSLDLANVILSDANGDALPLDSVVSGSVTVVPEPSTTALIGLGLASLGLRSRKTG